MTSPASELRTHIGLEDADVHTASDEYAARFSSPAGRWMLKVQEEIVLGLLGTESHCQLLDVGGGHGQLTCPLLSRGFSVTVLGSSEPALYQVGKLGNKPNLRLEVGNLLHLPFAENSFDVVLCFRLLTHCDSWPQLVVELCRVARKMVVVDYPLSGSLNKLTPLLFRFKKDFEKNTRPYTLFSTNEINATFSKHEFVPKAIVKQFIWPMVIHRAINSPKLSAIIETPFRTMGITQLYGSPAIAAMIPASKAGEPSVS